MRRGPRSSLSGVRGFTPRTPTWRRERRNRREEESWGEINPIEVKLWPTFYKSLASHILLSKLSSLWLLLTQRWPNGQILVIRPRLLSTENVNDGQHVRLIYYLVFTSCEYLDISQTCHVRPKASEWIRFYCKYWVSTENCILAWGVVDIFGDSLKITMHWFQVFFS